MTLEEQIASLQYRLDRQIEENVKLRDMVERLSFDLGIREHPIRPLEETEDKE